MEKVKIAIFFKGTRQNYGYFRPISNAAQTSLPKHDLLLAIFDLFHIQYKGNEDEIVRNAVFIDEDGDPVFFDVYALSMLVLIRRHF